MEILCGPSKIHPLPRTSFKSNTRSTLNTMTATVVLSNRPAIVTNLSTASLTVSKWNRTDLQQHLDECFTSISVSEGDYCERPNDIKRVYLCYSSSNCIYCMSNI